VTKRRGDHEVDAATLFTTSGFTAGELTSALEAGELPPPRIRFDGVAVFKRSDIERLLGS